ncbi:E3 ubiquitin- ligase DZIP3 [Paramuricea clavata]|uniref:E3 ubiquitin- ligase DZIP3 n=1 Tax=Paramuricea clavata TaxID=317549 RepID=A0A6S7IH79_PARCT|nr:E3 ubiquitin- ligase DZIP3 [Paramuricea clavata]
MPLDELTKKRRTRAAHRGSATKIGTKIKECLVNVSETPQTDKNVLKQLRDTLSEKLEALKLLDNEIVEVLSNSEAEDAEQQLEKEIQETDDTRAELQKIILDVNDALFQALPSLPQGQSTPSNLSMNATPKQTVRAKLPKLERAHIQALMNIKPVYNERDVRRLRELYHACETNCRGLKTLGVDESSYATIVVPEILDKLPESLRLTITRGSSASGSDFLSWTMKDILKALLDEIELREAHESSTTNTSKQERRKPQFLDGSAAALVNHTTREGKPRCVYCLQEHLSQDCKKIKNAGERKQILRKYGRCFVCLKRGHISSNCLNTSKCSACSKRHHSSICESHANGSITADVVHSTHSCVGSANRVALQTAQALVMGGKENVRVRVMFDSGSQRSFVTGKVAQKAGVPVKRKEWVEIRTFGQEKVEGKLREVFELNVAPVQGGESVSIDVYGVDSISQIRNEHVETRKKDYPHLQGLWFSDVCKTKNVLEIELLIGADYLWLFQEGRTVRGKSNEPVAVQTKLGWVLSGPLKSSSEDDDGPTSCAQVSVNLIGHVTSSKNRSLEACVEKLWDYETLGIKHEEEASELLNDSIHFNGQRYSVSLPWKEGHSLLPTNYSCSVQRLKGQLRES